MGTDKKHAEKKRKDFKVFVSFSDQRNSLENNESCDYSRKDAGSSLKV